MVREHLRLPCVRGAVKIGTSEPILTEGLSLIEFDDPSVSLFG